MNKNKIYCVEICKNGETLPGEVYHFTTQKLCILFVEYKMKHFEKMAEFFDMKNHLSCTYYVTTLFGDVEELENE